MESGIISASAALQERLARLRASDAFKNYEYVRERVLEMRAQIAASPEHKPSAYWEEELSTFEYMLDASPLVIEKLRHHTHWITGIRAYEYRSQRKRAKVAARRRRSRRCWRSVCPNCSCSEWRALGGYGFEHDGKFFNIDTTKFYEVLIALERGAVLPEFRNNADRRLVWEIGAGWGGFPYQFKTRVPERHLRHQRLSRVVPLLGDVSDDGVPGREGGLLGGGFDRAAAGALARVRLHLPVEYCRLRK